MDEILSTMLDGDHRPPRRQPIACFLGHSELERLGSALDRRQQAHPLAAAAIRLLTLTGARLPEILHLRRDAIEDEDDEGTSVRLGDSKTVPRTIWFGPEAVQVIAALPRGSDPGRLFPRDLTADRLQAVWRGVREDTGLLGLRLHDFRHTFA